MPSPGNPFNRDASESLAEEILKSQVGAVFGEKIASTSSTSSNSSPTITPEISYFMKGVSYSLGYTSVYALEYIKGQGIPVGSLTKVIGISGPIILITAPLDYILTHKYYKDQGYSDDKIAYINDNAAFITTAATVFISAYVKNPQIAYWLAAGFGEISKAIFAYDYDHGKNLDADCTAQHMVVPIGKALIEGLTYGNPQSPQGEFYEQLKHNIGDLDSRCFLKSSPVQGYSFDSILNNRTLDTIFDYFTSSFAIANSLPIGPNLLIPGQIDLYNFHRMLLGADGDVFIRP